MKDYKNKYAQHIETSLIIILTSFTIIFYLFPNFERISLDLQQYNAPAIEVVNIPITNQSQTRKPPPRKPVIPIEAEIIELLDFVEIEEVVLGDSSISGDLSGPVSYTSLPFTPRQLLDVLPEKNDYSISGKIIFSLRIGIDGQVKDYKVIKNTTDCESCLQKVVTAVLQSKWEPAIIDDQNVEYWIDKTYDF